MNDGNPSSITTHRPSSHHITSHSLKWNGIKIRNWTHRRWRHRRLHQMTGSTHSVQSKCWNLSVRCRRRSEGSADWRCILRQQNGNSHRQIGFGRRCSTRSGRRPLCQRSLFLDAQFECLCHLLLRGRSCWTLSSPLYALFGYGPGRRGWNIRYLLIPIGDPENIKVVVGAGLFVLGIEQNYHVGVIVVIAIALLKELLHGGRAERETNWFSTVY